MERDHKLALTGRVLDGCDGYPPPFGAIRSEAGVAEASVTPTREFDAKIGKFYWSGGGARGAKLREAKTYVHMHVNSTSLRESKNANRAL